MTTSTPVSTNATKPITSSKKKKAPSKNNQTVSSLIDAFSPMQLDNTTLKNEEVCVLTADGPTITVAPSKANADTKGRKTRGSKIVTKQQITTTVITPPLTNIILNLKCSMNDLKEYNDKLNQMISNPLEYNSSAPPDVKYYDGEQSFSSFIQNDANKIMETHRTDSRTEWDAQHSHQGEDKPNSNSSFISFSKNTPQQQSVREGTSEESKPYTDDNILSRNGLHFNTTPYNGCNMNVKISKNEIDEHISSGHSGNLDDGDDVNIKDMSAKLKQLKIQLYKNTLNSEKKSACFWCTYDFDNAPCYIPKYEMDGTIYGYGSFCRPECAVAYLMKETIDDSTKFDRYHLLNQIYSKVYECKKNIKPAPDPHYLLDKFYGNLNIQEYRRLLKTEHLLLVIDKPLTRILPELHEDTDDAFTKIYGIKASSGNSSGVYKVKRQSEQPQGPSKASIIKNTFGIST